MLFGQIDGKADAKKRLINQVARQRIPHAQLFLGREGSGALAMALAYASFILCEDRQENDACGQCNSCQKSQKYIHPDLHFSFPVVTAPNKKRADTTSDDFLPLWRKMLEENPFFAIGEWLTAMDADKSLPNINVREINEIMQRLNMMSYESQYKILVMWLPEYLGVEGNRLLKLIEEPTDNTFLILVAENQDLILQTILSRCQLTVIPAFENHEIADHLSVKLKLDANRALQIANMSDGNLSLALSIANNEATDFSDMFISWLRIAFKSDPLEINEWINGVTELSKDDLKNFFEYGLHFLRQLLLKSMAPDLAVQLTDKEQDVAAKMSALINLQKLEKMSEILEEAIDLVNRNINVRIMLFSDTLTLGDMLRSKV